jgi:TetR/AcrR family transcriptional repressor of nem operon
MTPVKAPEDTRNRILQTAFEEIHKNGFQGSSINQIVEEAGITKGALFHHFKSKKELGYAVIDEIIHGMIKEEFIDTLNDSSDPIQDLKNLILTNRKQAWENPSHLCNGCPLNNLAQEMSPLDEGFRTRIEGVFTEWRACFAKAFKNGIKAGTVAPTVSPESTAAFLVSAFEGIVGTAKSAQNRDVLNHSVDGFISYLDSLRP